MFEHRWKYGVFTLGGMLGGSAVAGLLSDQQQGLSAVNLGFAAVLLGLILWNVQLYRTAGVDPDSEFPTSAVERYTLPITLTVSLIIGIALNVIPHKWFL